MSAAKPRTFQSDLANLPAALTPLTEEKRWVVWSWEWRVGKNGSGKWTKPPQMASNPHLHAKSNDPATWCSYEEAVKTVTAGDADGIGYTLLGADIGAIDLDHAKDDATGVIEPWAEKLTAEANGAYIETTVSGAGLRAIGKASGPEVHRKFTFDRKTGAGVELYRNTARYITISGLEIGSCAELPSIDNFIDTTFARYSGQNAGFDYNAAGSQQSSSLDYDDLIRNGAPEGNRSDLFQAVIWHLANKGWSVNQIVDELIKYPNGIGRKYANRLHKEVGRSYEKWLARKRTAAGATATPGGAWPQIYIRAGELPRIVNEAETALLSLGREIYQRGGLLVRPVLSTLKAADERDTRGWNLTPVTVPYLVENLTRAAQFLKWDSRTKSSVPTDAPQKVAETYLARAGEWKLPVLTGIVTTPFLRSDGSICETPGYDNATGMLFKPDGQDFPPIPQSPSKEDALAALTSIDKLIGTFPFVAETDRSVMLSAILTGLDRRSMTTAPLHAFTAPAQGSGKSMLVDLVSMLVAGQPAPVIAQGRTEEELEKRLGAALLRGDAIVSIDNCEYPLQSSFLCQVLTQQRLSIRMLGHSRNVEVPVTAAIFATGNNLSLAGDLIRRALLCTIDARCEHPEQRRFDSDPISIVQASRGMLVAAALTVLRAWHASNDRIEAAPFGSFEEWSYRIRAPLLWLGCADPCSTVQKVRDSDPQRTALGTVLTQWQANLGAREATVRQVIEVAVNSADFHGALLVVAADKGGSRVSSDRLGRWLKKVERKIVNGLTLEQTGNTLGYPKWHLTRI